MPEEKASSGAKRAVGGLDPLTEFWSVRGPRWLDSRAGPLGSAMADGAWTAVWRPVAAYAPVIAFATGLLMPLLKAAMTYVFSESLVFLALVIAGGILSGPVGVMLLLGYAVGEPLGRADPAGGQAFSSPAAELLRRGGSHLVSYILLSIPAVAVPLVARGLALRSPTFLAKRKAAAAAWRAAVHAASCALLIFVWCQAMTAMVRPVFTLLRSNPSVEAVFNVQRHWPWLVGIAAVAAVARVILEQIMSGSPHHALVAELRRRRYAGAWRHESIWLRLPAPVKVGLFSALTTLLLGGTFESGWDALLAAAAIAALQSWRLGVLGRMPARWSELMASVPLLLRVVSAVVLGYGVAYVPIAMLWKTGSMRAVLLGVLLAGVVVVVLFPRAPAPPAGSPGTARAGAAS